MRLFFDSACVFICKQIFLAMYHNKIVPLYTCIFESLYKIAYIYLCLFTIELQYNFIFPCLFLFVNENFDLSSKIWFMKIPFQTFLMSFKHVFFFQ